MAQRSSKWTQPLFAAIAGACVAVASFAVAAETDTGGAPAGETGAQRLVLAFYYTWYGTPSGSAGAWRHWQENDHDPARHDERGARDLGAAQHPMEGPYDSLDPATVRRHAAESAAFGIDGWVSTWWGKEDASDRALDVVLKLLEEERSSLVVSVYYETCGGSTSRAVADLLYILERYGGRPRFLKHGGKPVVFVYSRALGELGADGWLGVVRDVRARQPCVLSADSEDPRLIAAFGAGHGYNPVTRVLAGDSMTAIQSRFAALCRASGAVSAATVLPGYDDRRVRAPGLYLPRRGGRTYDELWGAARGSGADWVLVTSFNEWHEGTEIEPSLEHGLYYLEATRRHSKRFHAGEGWLVAESQALADGIRIERMPSRSPAEAVLVVDPFRPARTLSLLGGDELDVRISGIDAVLVSQARTDDVLRGRTARPAGVVSRSSEPARLILGPDEEVHIWSAEELARWVGTGGYGGSEEVAELVRSGWTLATISPALPADGRGRRIVASPGMTLPLGFELRASRSAEAGRTTVMPATVRLEGDSRVRFTGGELSIAAGAPAGEYLVHAIAEPAPEAAASKAAPLPVPPRLPVATMVIEVRQAFVLRVTGSGGGVTAVLERRVAAASAGHVRFGLGPAGQASVLERGAATELFEATGAVAVEFRADEVNGLRADLPLGLAYEAHARWNGGEDRLRVLLDAGVEIGEGTEGTGLRHVGVSLPGDGGTRAALIQGTKCRVNLPGLDAPSYFYFRLDDAFLRPGTVTVRVEYLDRGARWLGIEYDSLDDTLPMGGAYKLGGRVDVGTSDAWRVQSFRLPDARLRGRQNFGADFRLVSASPIFVARVTVAYGDD